MMKRVLPVLAGAAFAQAASAPSNVAIFGTVDLGIRVINNSGSGTFKSVGNQGNLANRLGFKGEEDLGGGLKASFHIETGILPDTGESLGQSFGIGFWNRQATVERSRLVAANLSFRRHVGAAFRVRPNRLLVADADLSSSG
jgi:predicted porin